MHFKHIYLFINKANFSVVPMCQTEIIQVSGNRIVLRIFVAIQFDVCVPTNCNFFRTVFY